LFKIFSDPLTKSREELENFFAKYKPSVKKSTLGLYVDTFKTLCEFADFGASSISLPRTPLPEVPAGEKIALKPSVRLPITKEGGINLDVSIRIELPVTQDAEVYDKIFKSLKKHLLTPSSETD